jgi:hypothetical protein
MNMRRSWALGGAAALLATTMVSGQGPVAVQGGRGQAAGGDGGFGGAFGGKTPTALRAIPAEPTSAKAKDATWKAPRTAWGLPIPARVMGMAVYTGQVVEGREDIREFGGSGR